MGVGSWAACKWPFLQGLVAHLGGIEKSDVFGAMGVSIAFLGLVTNVWFNWRRDKRERAALKARMGDVH